MAKKRSLPSVPVSEPRKPLQTGENLTKADRQKLDQTNEELPQTVTESQTVFDRVLSQQAKEVLVPLLKRQSCMRLYRRIDAYLDNEPVSALDIEVANNLAQYAIEKCSSDSIVARMFEEQARQANEMRKLKLPSETDGPQDPNIWVLEGKKHKVNLPPTAFKLAKLVWYSKNQCADFDAIAREVFDDNFVEANNIIDHQKKVNHFLKPHGWAMETSKKLRHTSIKKKSFSFD